MRNQADTDQSINQIMQLLDDGTLTEDERMIVTQSLENPQLAPSELALMEELKSALQAATLPGEGKPIEPTIVQSIVSKLCEQQGATQGRTLETQVSAADAQALAFPQDLSGQTIGSYQVVRLIGRGGMGSVYEAVDQLLHRRVALKVMLPYLAANSQHRARFLREARAAAHVEHDHVCPIYQVGEDRGVAYMAMPLLAGETLERRLLRGPLNPNQIIDVVEQIAKGLAAAHQAGLIHRDIKPANVWLESRLDAAERVRLLDFGLAQMETEEPHLTQPGSIIGTPSYMSPEQARGRNVDGRTDLFSVGALLYELLTGQKAFVGDSPTAVLSSILVDHPKAPVEFVKACPKCLSDLTLKLLEKVPSERLPSATQLLVEIARCRSQLGPASGFDSAATQPFALPHGSASAVFANPLTPDRPALAISPARGGRPGWRIASVAACGLAGAFLAFVLLFKTANGTLQVEVSDDAKVLFEKGEVHVLDDSGKLAYRLTAHTNSQSVKPGEYKVQVVGVDGLQLSTEAFEIKRNNTTSLRVTAIAESSSKSSEKPQAETQAELPVKAIARFQGRVLIDTDFNDSKPIPVRIRESKVTSEIDKEILTAKRSHDASEPFITLSLPTQLNRGAMVSRVRGTAGAVFFCFCTRNDGTRSRWLSLSIKDGGWTLYLQRQDLKNGTWTKGEVTTVATSSGQEWLPAAGAWTDVALRWSERDFDVWINDHHAAGGTLPSEELSIGRPDVSQICMRTVPSETAATLEVDRVSLWDQSEISVEAARQYPTMK